MNVPFDQPEYERCLGTAEQTLTEGEGFAAQGLHHWASFAAQQAAEAVLKRRSCAGSGRPS